MDARPVLFVRHPHHRWLLSIVALRQGIDASIELLPTTAPMPHPLRGVQEAAVMSPEDIPVPLSTRSAALFLSRLGADGGRALLGETPREQASVDVWLDWNSTKLEPAVRCRLARPIKGGAGARVLRYFWELDQTLLTTQYLTGNCVRLADACVVCTLARFNQVFELASGFHRLRAWLLRVCWNWQPARSVLCNTFQVLGECPASVDVHSGRAAEFDRAATAFGTRKVRRRRKTGKRRYQRRGKDVRRRGKGSTHSSGASSASLLSSAAFMAQADIMHDNRFLLIRPTGTSTECSSLGLVVLNTDLGPLFQSLFTRASATIYADGGCNQVYDQLGNVEARKRMMPDAIVGDLDSLRPAVQLFYESLGVPVVEMEDQDTTDMMKALLYLKQSNDARGTKVDIAVCYGAFGGRFDQVLGGLQTLFTHRKLFKRLVLLSDGNIAELLAPGKHVIRCHARYQEPGSHCGLVPVGHRVERVVTTGLAWNLDGQSLEFGHLVSTCNIITAEVVTVETSGALLWTTEFCPLRK